MSEEAKVVEENKEQEISAEAEVSELTDTEQEDTEATAPVATADEDAVAADASDVDVGDESAGEPADEPATAEAEADEPVAEAAAGEDAVAADASDADVGEESADEPAAEPVSAQDESDEPVAEAEDGTTDVQSDAETEEEEDEDGKKVVYLSVGQEVDGVVKRTTDFGAFVDIGAGRDGLVHISELAVGRINKVTDVVKEGEQIVCWIKKLDRKRNRISLTLIPPGTKTVKDLEEGTVIEGKVSKIMPYGAFIDIGVGTDGLLHIREMSTGYVNKPEDVVKAGQEIEVRVIGVDRRRRRIDLSLKGLRDEPETEERVEVMSRDEGQESVEDPFANVEVLSPMELAFKKAMEAEGVEVDVEEAAQRERRRRRKSQAVQEEIINRTLETMND